MQGASPLLVAQITDTHLLAASEGALLGVPTTESCATILERVQSLDCQPDLLLMTGDLSQDETPASYERLAAKIGVLGIPAYWLPGNHDCWQLMEKILCEPPISTAKVFQKGGWQFILLDSSVPGQVHGCLSDLSLQWLDDQLQLQPDLPTLVSLHHPPFKIDSAWIDQSRLKNPEDLFAVLDRYAQVRLVVFGHIHQDFARERRGVRYLASPSTCVQFKPKSRRFCLDDLAPGFRLLSLHADGSVETCVERVPLTVRLDLSATGY
ncbi:MAG: 3',5'-cyclic-AMP phosphodiesterase [Cyanobacteria bacterium J06641_5]